MHQPTAFTRPWQSDRPRAVLTLTTARNAMVRPMIPATASAVATFEPVLNVPAFGTTVLIMTMALLLRLRIGAIGDAADRRIAALEALRTVKSRELDQGATPAQVAAAISAYETALEREESLRTLLPGIRIRAPNNPALSERDRRAERQFLKRNGGSGWSEEQEDEEAPPSSRLGPIAISVMVTFLFGSQILLFVFLSMDDTTTTTVLNAMTHPETATLITPSSSDGTVAETIGNLVGLE